MELATVLYFIGARNEYNGSLLLLRLQPTSIKKILWALPELKRKFKLSGPFLTIRFLTIF